MRRIGPVRTVVVPIMRCAAGLRDGGSQVRRSGRPVSANRRAPSPLPLPCQVPTVSKAAAQRKRAPAPFMDAAEPPATAPSPVRPRRPRRSRRRRLTPDRRSQLRPRSRHRRPRCQRARARPDLVAPRRPSPDPRRGPEPNPKLCADASRSGAERRLDTDADPCPRRRDGSRPRPRGQRGTDARSVDAATDGRHPRGADADPLRIGPRAGPRATRRPRPRPCVRGPAPPPPRRDPDSADRG